MAKKVPSLNEANSPSGDPPNNPAKKSETEYVGLSENTCLYLVMEYRTAGANRDAWELNVCRVIDFSLSDVKQAHAELMSVIGNRFPDVYNDSDFKKKVIGNPTTRRSAFHRIFDGIEILDRLKPDCELYFHHEKEDRSVIINSANSLRAIEQVNDKVSDLFDT